MTSGDRSLAPVDQSPGVTPVPSAGADEVDAPRLSTAVMFVHDLDASISFYSEVLQMAVTVRQASAALLVNAGSCQLYLRQMGERTPHPLGAIGVQVGRDDELRAGPRQPRAESSVRFARRCVRAVCS